MASVSSITISEMIFVEGRKFSLQPKLIEIVSFCLDVVSSEGRLVRRSSFGWHDRKEPVKAICRLATETRN